MAPSLARAQSIADRASLAAWGDSLRAITSPAQLATLERAAGIAPSVDGLRQNLFLLRRGELAHRRGDLAEVIRRTGLADHDHGDWRWIPFVLARAYAALEFGGWHDLIPDDKRNTDEPYAVASWRYLVEALRRDPEFAPARRWMIGLMVAGGDRLMIEEQRAMLEREVARPMPDPDALLVWGRYLRAERRYDKALTAFNQSLARGGDSSRLALERARTLRTLHNRDGAAAAYWSGIDHLTAVGREMYHYDLAWIVAADSLAAFDRTPDNAVAGWLHRFWDERDAAAANHPGERLDEHLRRWSVAFARYRARTPWRRSMYHQVDLFFDNDDCLHRAEDLYATVWRMPPVHPGDLRSSEWLLDHRGIMYLRHGQPLQRFGGTTAQLDAEDFRSGPDWNSLDSTSVWSAWAKGRKVKTFGGGFEDGVFKQGLVPYQTPPRFVESWLYFIDGQLQLLHFRDSYAIGMSAATTLTSFLPFNWATAQWSAISATLPEYQAAAARIAEEAKYKIPDSMPKCWNEMRVADARSRADLGMAIHEDSDSPPLVTRWRSVIQMYALGDGRTEPGKALLSFAFGGDALHALSLGDGTLAYPIQYRVVAWERATGRTITLDTARDFTRAAPLPAGDGLVSFLELPLPAGDWQVAVRATQGLDSVGAYALRRDLHIDTTLTIALSDIVLGIEGSPPWRAPDGSPFAVNAMASWPAGGTAELFYEVMGLAANEEYRTTIEVRPVDPKQTSSVRVASTDRASGAVTHVRRALALERLAPGKYDLIVTVEAGGKKVSRHQVVVLVGAH